MKINGFNSLLWFISKQAGLHQLISLQKIYPKSKGLAIIPKPNLND